MSEQDVSVAFTLKDLVSPALDKILDRLEKATTSIAAFQEKLDRLGAKGLNKLLAQFDKLERVRWPGQLTEGADKFDKLLLGADEKMAALSAHARELAAALKEIRVPAVPAVPPGGHGPGGGGRGGHGGGGDPIMGGIEGGAVLEFLGGNYERYSRVDQVYRAMQSDRNLAGANNPIMAAIRGQSGIQLDRYKAITPLDVAKNAAEAYAISGGQMEEQSAIADALDRLEQNMVIRGKSPEDAQRQAAALVKAGDVANRFFDPKTGHLSIERMNTELNRMQALVAVGGGFTTGQSVLSFEKSSKLAGQRLSLEGEAALAHFIEIDPRNAGNRLNSFENLFGGHATRMTKKDKAFWSAHGLYDKSGMLVDNDLLGSDPMAWMAKHFAGFNNTQIDDHSQRMNVSAMVQEARGAQGNIDRQKAATERSSVDANAKNLLNSPIGATIQFEASLERFRTTLGKFEAGPGTKILNSLTDGLAKLDDVLEKHPQATDILIKLSAALAGFMVIRGVAALTGIGEGIMMLSRGVGLFAKGTAAEAALETMTAGAGAGSLFGLSAALVALGAAIIALPPIGNKLLGKRDDDRGPASNAHGAPYIGPRPAGKTPQQRMQDGLDAIGRELSSPQSHGNSRGLPTSRVAYFGGDTGHVQPVVVQLMVDGREMARSVTHHQTQAAMRPSAMGNSPDPMEVPFRAGMPVQA